MRGCGKTFSLVSQVRKVVTYRIIVCLFLLYIAVFSFTIYDGFNSFTMLQRNIKSQCDGIKSFVVSQILIDNKPAVQAKLDQINQQLDSIHFTWVEQGNFISEIKDKMNWAFPLGWNYYYPISSLDNLSFGYLKVHGSFFADKVLLYQFLIRVMLLLVFSVSMFLLLYPLATRVPRLLFIKPIHELLKLIKARENYQHDMLVFPSEIHEISEEIKFLFYEVEKKSQETAFTRLATQVAHDIRSPLTALDVAIKEIMWFQ